MDINLFFFLDGQKVASFYGIEAVPPLRKGDPILLTIEGEEIPDHIRELQEPGTRLVVESIVAPELKLTFPTPGKVLSKDQEINYFVTLKKL